MSETTFAPWLREDELVEREMAAFDRVAEKLAGRFPDIPAETVVDAVRAEHQRFMDSSVRDFLPILVERSLRRRWGSLPVVPRHSE